MTYGRWKIHGPVVNTNLQRRWENMSLASNLPITLTYGAVMGRYWCMHISSNLISCLKSEQESGSSCGNNDIILYVHMVTQPNQASRTDFISKYRLVQLQNVSCSFVFSSPLLHWHITVSVSVRRSVTGNLFSFDAKHRCNKPRHAEATTYMQHN